MGWRREDVQLAFIAGAEHRVDPPDTITEAAEAKADQV